MNVRDMCTFNQAEIGHNVNTPERTGIATNVPLPQAKLQIYLFDCAQSLLAATKQAIPMRQEDPCFGCCKENMRYADTFRYAGPNIRFIAPEVCFTAA